MRARAFAQPGDAKVHHHHRAFGGDHHVAGLYVPMDHGRVLLVGIFESAANVDDEADLLRERQARTAIEDFVEAFTGQELHGDEGGVAFVPELINGDDVGMLKTSRGARFGVETL